MPPMASAGAWHAAPPPPALSRGMDLKYLLFTGVERGIVTGLWRAIKALCAAEGDKGSWGRKGQRGDPPQRSLSCCALLQMAPAGTGRWDSALQGQILSIMKAGGSLVLPPAGAGAQHPTAPGGEKPRVTFEHPPATRQGKNNQDNSQHPPFAFNLMV